MPTTPEALVPPVAWMPYPVPDPVVVMALRFALDVTVTVPVNVGAAAGALLAQLNADSPDHEYTARIESIAGKTVVYLVRESREAMPPAYLRHG